MSKAIGIPVSAVADLTVADGIPQVHKHRFASKVRSPGRKIAEHVDFNLSRRCNPAPKFEGVRPSLSIGGRHGSVAVLRVEGDLGSRIYVYKLNVFILKEMCDL